MSVHGLTIRIGSLVPKRRVWFFQETTSCSTPARAKISRNCDQAGGRTVFFTGGLPKQSSRIEILLPYFWKSATGRHHHRKSARSPEDWGGFRYLTLRLNPRKRLSSWTRLQMRPLRRAWPD